MFVAELSVGEVGGLVAVGPEELKCEHMVRGGHCAFSLRMPLIIVEHFSIFIIFVLCKEIMNSTKVNSSS